jgi:hypothetical protein
MKVLALTLRPARFVAAQVEKQIRIITVVVAAPNPTVRISAAFAVLVNSKRQWHNLTQRGATKGIQYRAAPLDPYHATSLDALASSGRACRVGAKPSAARALASVEVRKTILPRLPTPRSRVEEK